jgi:hypothetical protein
MDPTKLLQYAEKALGNKAWTVELVLRIGVDLASAVNSFPNLTGEDKCRLVCATIQTMIDNSEKAGIEHMEESTEKENTKARLQECRNAVKMILPVSLNLVIMASRGKIPFQKVLEDISSKPWSWTSFRSWLSSLSFSSLTSLFSSFSLCAPCSQAIDTVVKHPQEYLEEMRGLVLRMEKLLEETKASSVTEVFAPVLPIHEQQQKQQEEQEKPKQEEKPKEEQQEEKQKNSPQPLPTPESLDVKLPGGLENP